MSSELALPVLAGVDEKHGRDVPKLLPEARRLEAVDVPHT